MSVSSIGQSNAAVQAHIAQAQTVDTPHDGDADDVAPPAPVQAAPAPGTGQVIDKQA